MSEAESLEMQFSQSSVVGMNGGGPNSANSGGYHPSVGGFLNGLPPPGMPQAGMYGGLHQQAPNQGPGGVDQHTQGGDVGGSINGMWVGQGSNQMKGKVSGSGPSPNSIMGDQQQLNDSGMVWVKWNQP